MWYLELHIEGFPLFYPLIRKKIMNYTLYFQNKDNDFVVKQIF